VAIDHHVDNRDPVDNPIKVILNLRGFTIRVAQVDRCRRMQEACWCQKFDELVGRTLPTVVMSHSLLDNVTEGRRAAMPTTFYFSYF